MIYSEKLYSYYLELARSPSSDTSFSGEDVRFSGEYEALESELGKAHSMHNHSQPDWHKVVEKSDALLRHESKDLRVAVWLTWALYQRESFSGLLAGLGLLRHLCEHHWAVVYPRKPRTRSAAFAWLVPRIEQVFAQSLSLKGQRPLFECMLEHLSRLDELWTESLGDEAPLLLPVRRQLSDRLRQSVQSDPSPEGVKGVITQVKQSTIRLLAPDHVVDNEKDAHKLLRTLQDSARPLCAWWLRQNATDLRALRLSRTLTWLAISSLPNCDNEQITPLRGPIPDKLKRYQERFQQGHYADLLLELEASLSHAPFWFDGVRMVWECLQALQADMAMTETEVHLALLLQRLPGLTPLRFHDGTPFADPVTRNWINTQVTRHLYTSVPKAAPDASIAPWEKALQDVTPVLRKDGLKAAIRMFKPGLQAARGERARFHWRLGLARLCGLAGKYDLAKIQLEQLDQELQQAGLQRWEPDLSLEVLQLLYGCCDVLPQSHAVREHKENIHRRLCHFDLEAVLE
ncbi:type VI secretion system protein TssA [Pseudomonas sp. CCM 7891]|uniref:Type VI secretion system protein TssA n=1 Tax=Pseudomonas karstica TaxID=1055468 RepID=A0A7X2RQ07_9PSED|nr:type VI secretion system protein TssA [Pseudomonas karstica]MTD18977.1 type VI secretion system protein TssA [Pseudomonas karstica]